MLNFAGVTATSVPGAPTIGTATVSATTASVPFTAPASNGGSPITSYTATSSPSGITGTLSQAGSGTITVSGLAANTAYTFTVTATNIIGTGPASAASNSVTTANVPGAPTIGTATVSGTTASVPFTAPASDGGSVITTYTATSTPGSITGTLSQAGSGTVTVSGLTGGTSYTFKVKATNAVGTGAESAASNSVTAQVTGQQAFTTPGCYCWVAPANVTSVSFVMVGGGGGAGNGNYFICCGVNAYGSGGGGGASLGYRNNVTVNPGSSYALRVGAGGATNATGQSSTLYISTTYTARGGNTGSCYVGGGGGIPCGFANCGRGGRGGDAGDGCYSRSAGGGGGGAMGYGTSTTAGAGGNHSGGGAGACGGGGGGGSGTNASGTGVAGGGVGILGQGTSGASSASNQAGFGGSGGANGSVGGGGGAYGGGGGGGVTTGGTTNSCRTPGGKGAVRIIWPGTSRSFPSTNTGDL